MASAVFDTSQQNPETTSSMLNLPMNTFKVKLTVIFKFQMNTMHVSFSVHVVLTVTETYFMKCT